MARRIEVAVTHQEFDELLAVVGGQRHIQLPLVDRLGNQLAGVADEIGFDFAQKLGRFDTAPRPVRPAAGPATGSRPHTGPVAFAQSGAGPRSGWNR